MSGWRDAARFLTILLLVTMGGPALAEEAEMPDPRWGGNLAYGEFQEAVTYEPITTSDPVSARISGLIFEGLIGFDERGEVEGRLAESWDISSNGLTYTFHLRPEVRWHDGRLLSASDVKATWDIIMAPDTPTSLKSFLGFIRSVQPAGEQTVIFQLEREVYNALGRFSFPILPAHHFVKRELTRASPFVRAPVGTGPYMFSRVTDEGWVELEQFPDYHRGRSNLDRITSRHFIDRNLMTEALLTEAIDVIPSVQPKDVGRIQDAGRFQLLDYNSLSYSFFAYNYQNPHLARFEVRQALTLAVNRQEMLDTFFAGKGKVISGPFAPGSYSYNPNVAPMPFNPIKAGAMLRRAGYRDANGDGILERAGSPLRLVLKARISDQTMRAVCVAYQDYLRAVGVKVELQFLDRFAWERDVLRDHDFDITLASWIFDDASDITSLFSSGQSRPWGNNFISYSDPEVDELLARFTDTTDSEERRAINYELHRRLAQECPYTFLWTLTRYAAVADRFHNVRVDPFDFFGFITGWYEEIQ